MSATLPPSLVEATSLQQVTQFAASPPLNYNARLPPNTPPLTLYIARVPGSRDVFLTPIKPREQIVTAGDVQSSLYYLHINGPEDYEDEISPALPAQPAHRPTSVDTNSSNLTSLPSRSAGKKVPPPLPKRREARDVLPNSPYPMNNGMLPQIVERPPSPPPHQYLPNEHDGTSKKPVLSSNLSEVDLPTLPPRRPLQTPPRDEQQPESLHAVNVRLLQQSSLDDTHDNPYTRSYATHPETLKQADLDSRPESGTLTLIRRDPGSGEQWNVATINDPPVEVVSSSSLFVPTANRRTKKGGRPLLLDITNPAYAQFLSDSLERTESRLSISSSTSSSEHEPQLPEGAFRRRLYLPGSGFSEHGYASSSNGYHRKHPSLSSASATSTADSDIMSRTLRSDRHHSVDVASLSSASANTDRRTKGYTFTSPWNGQCEFSTGTTGRSLKCRHHLPGGQGGAEVSELRFNLPTKNRPPLLASKSPSSFLHRRRDSFEADDGPGIILTDDGRISLELGRERAGGGFGGKQAKLGKLIVWPEGVKMLDLLVAANLGLWWRAWERANGG